MRFLADGAAANAGAGGAKGADGWGELPQAAQPPQWQPPPGSPPQHRPNRPDRNASGKVFVHGLPPDVTSDELRAYFERFGPVRQAAVPLDEYGVPRDFGFVTFEGPASARPNRFEIASQCVAASHEMRGSPLSVRHANQRENNNGGGGEAQRSVPAEQIRVES